MKLTDVPTTHELAELLLKQPNLPCVVLLKSNWPEALGGQLMIQKIEEFQGLNQSRLIGLFVHVCNGDVDDSSINKSASC